MRRALTALSCAAALVALIGCGESEQEQAREVVQDYVDASNEDDFERICELYTDELRQQQGGENCPAFVEEHTSGVEQELELVGVRVNDDRGTADIDIVREAEGGPARTGLQLEQLDDEWLISGFQ